MEIGTLELQIFVSLVVILGTAFVALVCDYLKGSNESLREHNIELRVRKEEQEKHRAVEAVEWLQHLMGASQKGRAQRQGLPSRTITRPQRPAPAAAAARVQPPAASAPVPVPASEGPAADRPFRTLAPQPETVRRRETPAEAAPAVRVASRPPLTEERKQAPAELELRLSGSRPQRQAVPLPDAPSALPATRIEEPASGRASAAPDEAAPAPVSPTASSQEVPAAAPASSAWSFSKPSWRIEQPAVAALQEAAPTAAPTEPVPTVSDPPQPPAVAAVSAERPKKSEGFWSYRGLMDRLTSAQESASPTVESSAATEAPGNTSILLPQAASDQPKESAPATRNDSPVGAAVVPSASRAETAADHPAPAAGAMPFLVAPESEPHQAASGPAAGTPAAEPASPVTQLQLAPGFHDRSVLSVYLQSSEVLTGVVVAIGINDYALHKEKLGAETMQDLMRNVEQMVASMLRPGLDFACRAADDEFILVFANETGADAQRRLSTISERLWNFQLRSLSNFSVLFSWGAVEVQNETMADATASASERMYQTKRNRKTISLTDKRRKLAVNL